MEAIYFGESDGYQTGRNETNEVVHGLAVSVPGSRHTGEGTRVLIDCEPCGEEIVFTIEAEGRMPDIANTTITCIQCGSEL